MLSSLCESILTSRSSLVTSEGSLSPILFSEESKSVFSCFTAILAARSLLLFVSKSSGGTLTLRCRDIVGVVGVFSQQLKLLVVVPVVVGVVATASSGRAFNDEKQNSGVADAPAVADAGVSALPNGFVEPKVIDGGSSST